MSTSSQVRADPAAVAARPAWPAPVPPPPSARLPSVDDAPGPVAVRPRRAERILLHALVFLTVVLAARGIGDGGFRYSDASRHAMDGVFVYDFVTDFQESISEPFDYAVRYYAQYPSLGFVLHYPPLFAVVEAVFFAVFGVSAFTARMTVVAFAILGVVVMYKLLRLAAGPAMAALSTALYISLPTVVKYSRAVMLEVPTAAMILTATYFFYRYAELRHRRSAIWTGLLVVAAIMTKQTAVFLVPAFAGYLVIRRRWGVCKQWQFWVGAAVVAVVIGPYFMLSLHYAYYLARRVGGDSSVLVTNVRKVWRGWSTALSRPGLIALLAAALACSVWELIRPRAKFTWLLVCLLAAFFLESIYVGAGGDRYVSLILPILAVFPMLLIWRTGLLQKPALAAAVGVAVLGLAALSFARPVPIMRGHAEAARQLVARAGPSPFVLFDGHWDGDVVFFVRKYDPQRRLYVLRGSKMLYAYASFVGAGQRDLITSEKGIVDFIQRYGIRAVAVEEEDPDLEQLEPAVILRYVLQDSERFSLVSSCRITAEAENTSLNDTNLLVYEVKTLPQTPMAEELVIPLVGLRRTLTVPLNGHGKPRIDYLPWNEKK